MSSAVMPTSAGFSFDDGEAYERSMGRWSALVAQPFLDWLALPDGLAWLDDGCGDGSFTEAMVLRQKPSSVVGIDPSGAQLAVARRRPNMAGVLFIEGNAQALPLSGASFDVAVMALVLFFLPDPPQGIRELARVVRPGGTIAAYHWDSEGGGVPLQPILEVVRAEGHRSDGPPSSWAASMAASETLWRRAGLVDVRTCQIEVSRSFDSFDDYWCTAYGSSRLRNLLEALPSAAVRQLHERVRDELGGAAGGPVVLSARANAVKGRKA